MESGKIKNNQLEASSSKGKHDPAQARLNNEIAWIPGDNDESPRLTIILGNKYNRITGIATQGSARVNGWVTYYKLEYSSATADFRKAYQNNVSMNCSSIQLFDLGNHVVWNIWRLMR